MRFRRGAEVAGVGREGGGGGEEVVLVADGRVRHVQMLVGVVVVMVVVMVRVCPGGVVRCDGLGMGYVEQV